MTTNVHTQDTTSYSPVTNAPLTESQKAVAESVSNLFLGSDVAKTQAAYTKQMEDLGLETLKLDKVLDSFSLLSSVLIVNPNPAQKAEISNALISLTATASAFDASQPGFLSLLTDPNSIKDAKNLEMFMLLSSMDQSIKALIADPTNALDVITSQLCTTYAQYLSKMRKASAIAAAKVSTSKFALMTPLFFDSATIFHHFSHKNSSIDSQSH